MYHHTQLAMLFAPVLVMALNGLLCADVALRTYTLTQSFGYAFVQHVTVSLFS